MTIQSKNVVFGPGSARERWTSQRYEDEPHLSIYLEEEEMTLGVVPIDTPQNLISLMVQYYRRGFCEGKMVGINTAKQEIRRALGL